jgi:hypothetical protein
MHTLTRGPEWAVEPLIGHTNRIATELEPGQEFRILCQSDEHWDHPDCDRKLLKSHLDQATEGNCPVIKLGDSLCIMQAPMDKRASKGGTRPEHDKKTYLQTVCEDYARWHEPYAKQVALLAAGNHETKFMRQAGVSPTRMICKEFHAQHGHAPIEGGYTGYLHVQMVVHKTVKITRVIKWHHGSGGSAPVTKGILQTGRRAAVYPDADVYISGHTHEQWCWAITRERHSRITGRTWTEPQYHIQLPSYKDSLTRKEHGWEVEMGFQPQPTGAYWLVFKPYRKDGQYQIHTEVQRASPI